MRKELKADPPLTAPTGTRPIVKIAKLCNIRHLEKLKLGFTTYSGGMHYSGDYVQGDGRESPYYEVLTRALHPNLFARHVVMKFEHGFPWRKEILMKSGSAMSMKR